jgi:hypothetical protein
MLLGTTSSVRPGARLYPTPCRRAGPRWCSTLTPVTTHSNDSVIRLIRLRAPRRKTFRHLRSRRAGRTLHVSQMFTARTQEVPRTCLLERPRMSKSGVWGRSCSLRPRLCTTTTLDLWPYQQKNGWVLSSAIHPPVIALARVVTLLKNHLRRNGRPGFPPRRQRIRARSRFLIP